MSEIEKMYKNTGVKKYRLLDRGNKLKWVYPKFTAEKQINLIKWLSKRRLLSITFCEDKNTYQLFNDKCTGSFCSDFATSIATLVQCELDLCTEEEQEQIKEILE